jgi:Ca2+-binding RTX toxin-like protein
MLLPQDEPSRGADSVSGRKTRRKAKKPILLVEPMEQRQLLNGSPFLAAPLTYPLPGGTGFPVFSVPNATVGGDGKTEIFAGYNVPGPPEGVAGAPQLEGKIEAFVPNADGTFPPRADTFIHDLGGEDTAGNGFNDELIAYTVGDVNGDGNPDVVFLKSGYYNNGVNYAGFIRVLNGSAGSYTGTSYSVGNFGTNQIFFLNSPATSNINANAQKPTAVALGDLTGDGFPDLVVGYFYNNRISVIPNDSGEFASQAVLSANSTASAPVDLLKYQGLPGEQVTVGDGPIAIQTGLLTGSSDADVVVANKISDNISVLLSTGARNFLPQAQYGLGTPYIPSSIPAADVESTKSYPTSMVIGDVTGDGVNDIVVGVKNIINTKVPLGQGQYKYSTYVTGQISVLLGNTDSTGTPNGTFKAAEVIPAGLNQYPISITTADINGDGIPDIVTANVNTVSNTPVAANTPGQLNIFLAKGGGKFHSPESVALAGTPASVTASNLTGDGREGLVVSETGPSTANSTGVYASQLQAFVNINPNQPGIALSNGQLMVTGTPGGDSINLTSNGSLLTVVVNTTTESFQQANIGAIKISGKGGNDSIVVGQDVPACMVNGNAGADTISVSNAANNTLNGNNGPDFIDLSGVTGDSIAATGNNSVSGGAGADTLLAGEGNDTLSGDAGNDSLVGGVGDSVAGTGGHDLLLGGPGNDTIFAVATSQALPSIGFETLFGAGGNDFIASGPGDLPIAGNGSDTVTLI